MVDNPKTRTSVVKLFIMKKLVDCSNMTHIDKKLCGEMLDDAINELILPENRCPIETELRIKDGHECYCQMGSED